MAIVASWGGDGLANGTTVTTSTAGLGDTAFSAISGASASNITVSATGSRPPRLSFPTLSSSTKFLRWYTGVIGTPTTYAIRVYFEFEDYGALSSTIARVSNAGTDVWRVDIAGTSGSPPGEVRLRGAGGTLLADSGAWGINTDTIYRLEVVANSGAVTAKLYEGESTTVLTTLTASVASTIDTVDIGPAVTTTTSVQYFDNIAVSNTASEIGPIPPGATVTTNTVVTTSNNITGTLYAAIPTGTTLIGTVGTENGPNGVPALTVTDSKGNTYTVDKQINNSTTMSVSIFSGRITSALTTSDTITVTSTTTRTRWALTVQAFDNITTSPVDKSATNVGSSSSISVGPTTTTATANQLVYAGFCIGVRAFTPGTGYTGSVQIATSAGSTDRAVDSEWKYVTSTGAQTATATLASSTSYAGALVTYKVAASNVPPTANAGPDQTVTVGTSVTLDGSGSSDSDGTIASYSWSQTGGTAVTLSSSTVAKPTFTAPASPTTLTFSLTVTDNSGTASTSPDTCTVTVANPTGYIAEAVAGIKTTSGPSLTLNFSKIISSSHTILLGIAVDAPATADSSPVFTVTDSKSNTYTVNAVGFRASTVGVAVVSGIITTPVTTADTLTITCTTDRGRWAVSGSEFDNILQSGLDKTITNNAGSTTSLATGSTATTLDQYEVIFASFGFGHGDNEVFSVGPHYTLAGTQQSTSVGSSDRAVASEYRVFSTSLAHEATGTLNDASSYAAALGTYHAIALPNQLPTANAGSPQTVDAFALTTLDGTNSSDEDGIVTGYNWSQTSGPTVTLSSNTAAQPTFTAPGVDGGTSLVFGLAVTDNSGGTSTNAANVTITVNSAEQFIAHGGTWTGMPEYAASGGTWS